jgi:hypothetical protein
MLGSLNLFGVVSQIAICFWENEDSHIWWSFLS